MITKRDLKIILSKMINNINYNKKIINNKLGNLKYKDDTNQTLLHIFVDNKYDERKCFLAIKSLLELGLDVNAEDDFEYNFIQTALYAGYSEKFILDIIKESLKYNLDVNHVDEDKDTIMHTAIYSDDYTGEVINIYNLLVDNGFDSTKVDKDNRNLIDAMIHQKQYSVSQIKELANIFIENIVDNQKQYKIRVKKK